MKQTPVRWLRLKQNPVIKDEGVVIRMISGSLTEKKSHMTVICTASRIKSREIGRMIEIIEGTLSQVRGP